MSTELTILCVVIAIVGLYVVLDLIAKIKQVDYIFKKNPDQQNTMEGKKVVFVKDKSDEENADGEKGHLEVIGIETLKINIYVNYVKRGIDKILAFLGLVLLSPLFLCISLAIKAEDPGPVFFTQKRVGQNKKFFKLHKFRSMRMDTPHDIPTHMLDNPDKYITRVGKFLRAHSLDELPQIWDIFCGNMAIIGPRPALWNQDVLTALRDQYDANNIRPGLTGWAQINGRDELQLDEKASLDGYYSSHIGFMMDLKCFLGSLGVLTGDKSIVEGAVGSKELRQNEVSDCDTNALKKKRIMITGADSYIGEAVRRYLQESNKDMYDVVVMSTRGLKPTPEIFRSYDVVFNVAGIAHIKETKHNKPLYYKVNRDLVVDIAKAAKAANVKHFILLSSMSVYGKNVGHILKASKMEPHNAYGDSKMQADIQIEKMACSDFCVSILRPPMVYGRGCKGNYQTLRKCALRIPFFPLYNNERSMIYIDNLCEFVKRVIDLRASGVFFPQNTEYVNTCEMVRRVADSNGKKVYATKIFNPIIKIVPLNIFKKVFGSLTYEKVDTVSKYSFETSIELTEEYGSEKQEGR